MQIESQIEYERALLELRNMGDGRGVPKPERRAFERRRYNLIKQVCHYILTRPRPPAISYDRDGCSSLASTAARDLLR